MIPSHPFTSVVLKEEVSFTATALATAGDGWTAVFLRRWKDCHIEKIYISFLFWGEGRHWKGCPCFSF
jgi:hypothetical protein